MRLYYIVLGVVCICSGCVSVRQTPLPVTQIPSDWQQPLASQYYLSASMLPCFASQQKLCYSNWWHTFNNQGLNQFMQAVIQTNHELKIATLNIQKANLNLQKEQDALLPIANITARYDNSSNYSLKKQESNHNRSASLGVAASWELDLWHKLKDQQDIAQWEQQATIADKQAVYLNLTATAVRSYLQLANLNQRIDYAQETLKHYQQLKQLLTTRLKAGQIASIDLVNADQTINQQKQNYQGLLSQKNELINQMAVLLNQSISQLPKDLVQARDSYQPLPMIAVGMPAEILSNRPDIQAAVWRLKQSLKQPDIARKNLYPNIVLTAGANQASSQLHQLLKLPILNLGIAINLPSLNIKESKRIQQNSDIIVQQAVLTYQDSLYKALSDVETKLSQYQYQQQQTRLINENQQYTSQLLAGQRIRYQAGVLSSKELLEAEENVRQANITLYEAYYNQQIAWIAITQALGGIELDITPEKQKNGT